MSGVVILDESLVSVIVPIYRVESYLQECLDSILGQTYQNLEIILVDDGSPDRCGTICDEYAARDQRIVVIHKENEGAGAARNTGLVRAKGKYIAFLDADDMYHPDTITKTCARAVAYDADIVIFGAKIIDRKGAFLWEKRVNTDPLSGEESFSAKEIPSHLYQITSCDPWNKLFRREFILSRGIRFQTLRTANDLYFTSFAMACAERIAVLPEPLVIHRMRNKGNLQTLKKDTPLDFLTALEQIKVDLCSCGLWEILERSFVNFTLEHCVYNYQTLHKAGRQQLAQHSERLYGLLELQERDESYYYNRNSYRQVCQWLLYGREHKHMGWFARIKEFLKRFLPPPVHAFNREMDAMRQFIEESRNSMIKEIHVVRESMVKEIHVVREVVRESMKKTVSNPPIYWDNSSEKRFVLANWGDLSQMPDLAEKFMALVHGLDAESIETIIRIIRRQKQYIDSEESAIDLFTRAEQEELWLLYDNFYSEILQITDSLFAYRNYLLPINHFESSVFYYKHGISKVKNIDKISGKAIIDVGGFIGDSILVLSELNPRVIYSFEAVPQNFELLTKTLELNQIQNVIAENVALGSCQETQTIHLYGGGSTFAERKDINIKRSIQVPVITLDDYVATHQIEDIGLIKVDIEGAEPEFLIGAKKTICQQRPILLLSIYHNVHDFFGLKPMIESWNLGYQFKIYKPTFENLSSEVLLIAEI